MPQNNDGSGNNSEDQRKPPEKNYDNSVVDGARPTASAKQRNRPLKHLQYGIFTVVWEACSPHLFDYDRFVGGAAELSEHAHITARLFRHVLAIAPIPLILHIFCSVWKGLSSAFGLYACSVLLEIVEAGVMTGSVDQYNLNLSVLAGIICALVSTLVARLLLDTKAILRSHLRAHFLPKLTDTWLRLDMQARMDPEISTLFPREYLYEEIAPGWDTIGDVCRIVGDITSLVAHTLVLLSAFLHKRHPDAQVLTLLCAAHAILLWICPLDGVGGRPYIFYTDNWAYHRLSALYKIIFGHELRANIITDNARQYFQEEYQRATNALGVEKNDPSPVRYTIRRAWYWDLLAERLLELSLVCFVLTQTQKVTVSSLTSMILLLQALNTIRACGQFSGCFVSLKKALSWAKRLYTALEMHSKFPEGDHHYPDTESSSEDGMKISFQHVSFHYPTYDKAQAERQNVLENISFTIYPGQTVLIVGVNGSGKSSMLKLLSRLYEPTSGKILVDDKPIESFQIAEVRAATCVVTQEQKIYPLSVWENLQIGLEHKVDQHALERAAVHGGSSALIQQFRERFDTNMGPVVTCYQSPTYSTNAGFEDHLPPRLKEEYARRFRPSPSLSGGEKQRLALSRATARIENSDIRLLVVDEPTAALDPIAELDLFTRLRTSTKRKTMIFVTHRFGHLAKHADMILCMKDGRILEKGTHQDLMDVGGEYATLYNAQG